MSGLQLIFTKKLKVYQKMQEFSHLSDADLLVLSSRIQAEIQRRRKEKAEAEDKKWADRLTRFPEAQIGCQTKIVWVSTVVDSIKFECKVAHPPFVCYLNVERDGDGSSKFVFIEANVCSISFF